MRCRCPGCQTTLSVKQQSQPIQVKCPKCDKQLKIPAASIDQQVATPSQPPRPAAATKVPDDPFGDLSDIPSPSRQQSTSGPAANFGFPAQPKASKAGGRKARTSSRKSKMPMWVFAVVGVVALLLVPLLWFAVSGLLVDNKGKAPVAAQPSTTPSSSPQRNSAPPTVAPPETVLPELGPVVKTFPSGVTMHEAKIRTSAPGPAQNMDLRVYLPKGFSADGSVPCVLVAPAGTPLLHGASIDGGDYHDETLPYAEAGLIAIHYSIDGSLPDGVDLDDERVLLQLLPTAFKQFKTAKGGVANGRLALKFAFEKIKGVDPKRICAAGHSSAGTLALLLAASEPGITHCAAYAPAYDTEKRMADAINDPTMQSLLPGIKPFIAFYSPTNHIDDFQCNLLVFHARDDGNVPFGDALAFTAKLKSKSKNVTFIQASNGGHYQPMIDQGIPAAINWLEK